MSETVLPEGWTQCLLGDVVSYGKTEKIKIDDVEPEDWILELEDIEKNSSKLLARVSVEERPFKSTKNVFQKGDVLYGKLRPYLNKVILADRNGVCSTEIIPINAEPFIYNPFLFHWLKSGAFQAYVNSVSYGVNMPRLGTKDGNAAPLVLAPVAEQKEIADRLDNLLAQVDSIKKRLDAIPFILKRFRQSVLTAALSGKLTEDWRKAGEIGQSSSEFLKQIEEKRREAWAEECERVSRKRKYKVAVEGDSTGLPDIPASWEWSSVDSLASKVVDGVHKKPNYQAEGVPFVTVKNLTAGVGISFDSLNYVSEEDHDEFFKRANPEKGDILISKDGTLGVVRQIKTDKVFSIFVSVALVKPVMKEMSDFLELAFCSPLVQSQMVGVGTGLQHIHLTDLRKDMIPVPPLKEQIEIVDRVSYLFSFSEQIETRLHDSLSRVNNLTQSILSKAFRGDLTEDWRAEHIDLISGENSAKSLLEKIKTEQSLLAKKPKKRRVSISKKKGGSMSREIVSVVAALKHAGKPLSGQELLFAAGYPSDSTTEQLESFFLEIREAIANKKIAQGERDKNGQDWFELIER